MAVSWEFGSEDYSFRRTLLPHIDVHFKWPKYSPNLLQGWGEYTAKVEGGRAEELQVLVRETMKRVLGEEHPDLLTSMPTSHLRTTTRRDGSRVLEVLVMEMRKRVLGRSILSLSLAWTISRYYSKQGRWKDAKSCRCCHGDDEEVLARASRTTQIMGNLASTYRNLGRWKELRSWSAGDGDNDRYLARNIPTRSRAWPTSRPRTASRAD